MNVGRLASSPRAARNAFDGGVEAVLEVDEGAVWPETVAQFVSSDEVSRTLEQRAQDLERLTLKLEARLADS
jgi:hypothetical protein